MPPARRQSWKLMWDVWKRGSCWWETMDPPCLAGLMPICFCHWHSYNRAKGCSAPLHLTFSVVSMYWLRFSTYPVGPLSCMGLLLAMPLVLCFWSDAATGREAISIKAEVLYDEIENVHQHQSKGDGEIELKGCPAYGKPHYTEDIVTEECPAYCVKNKRDVLIHLQECPAYGESKRQVDVGLEQNPAYLDIASCN